MASLMDLYAPSGPAPGLALADLNDRQSSIATESGLAKSRMVRDFDLFGLPDLVSRFAARGAAGSGALVREAGRARMQQEEGIGDIDRDVAGNLATIARQRTLATLGIQ